MKKENNLIPIGDFITQGINSTKKTISNFIDGVSNITSYFSSIFNKKYEKTDDPLTEVRVVSQKAMQLQTQTETETQTEITLEEKWKNMWTGLGSSIENMFTVNGIISTGASLFDRMILGKIFWPKTILNSAGVSDEDAIQFVKDIPSMLNDIIPDGFFKNTISTVNTFVTKTYHSVFEPVLENTIGIPINAAMNVYKNTIAPIYSGSDDRVVGAQSRLNQTGALVNTAIDFGSGIFKQLNIDSIISATSGTLLGNWLSEKRDSAFAKTVASIGDVLVSSLNEYVDGVSETPFGALMEESWHTSSNSFLETFKNKESDGYSVTFLDTTPLDSNESSSLYGSMILGAPFSYTGITDPQNRTIINSFVKDSRILSLTPGQPKYNGGEYSWDAMADKNFSILHQTTTGKEMLNWIAKNGMDSAFSEKDKRYYTFKSEYKEFFAYLETLLNTVWIKMGLGTEADDTKKFNMFSFFNIDYENGQLQTNNYDSLKVQYNSSIGFFIDPNQGVSESVESSPTSFGDELSGRGETLAEPSRKLNYITGMGTGSSLLTATKRIGTGFNVFDTMKENLISPLSEGVDIRGSFSGSLGSRLATTAQNALTLAKNVGRFAATEDMGSIIQSFATYNGMKTQFPELWSTSSYSKATTFNFNFVSPYGDPLSIFQYVYVPFLTLLTFALPRQAASNGLVSPFYVRADIPGVFTTDFGIIDSINWVKGGDNNLWTKDGLPRAISGQVTIMDLYPFLAGTKRISFLSSNPSLTVWLDNMAGMRAVINEDGTDPLNSYFNNMINRVNGSVNMGAGAQKINDTLWNVYSSEKSQSVSNYTNKRVTKKKSLSENIHPKAMPWVRK